MAGRLRSKKVSVAKQVPSRVLIIPALIAVTAIIAFSSRDVINEKYEWYTFAKNPTAEHAYEYGNRHFDVKLPRVYDLELAEKYYLRALAIDPKLPQVHHQIARIAFLKGDYTTALNHINAELIIHEGKTPSSYYVRGLIRGFIGEYAEAATDYEAYLRTDSENWAAINDYAWVLLKDNRPLEALIALDWGLIYWPQNAWLLNNKATALVELGQYEKARIAADAAAESLKTLTEKEWSMAYPGNDPLIAPEGLATFKRAVAENMHSIENNVRDRE